MLNVGICPVFNGVSTTSHRLVSNDAKDLAGTVGSSLEGLRRVGGDSGESLLRRAADDNPESCWSVVAGHGSTADSEGFPLSRNLDVDGVWNGLAAAGESLRVNGEDVQLNSNHRLTDIDISVKADVERSAEAVQPQQVLEQLSAGSRLPSDVRHVVVDEETHPPTHHDAAVKVPQPSTARSKTSECISYKDDFTAMSDVEDAASATGSRSVELFNRSACHCHY